jgi:formylglycine-generating enzyme required for sulfatase activity
MSDSDPIRPQALTPASAGDTIAPSAFQPLDGATTTATRQINPLRWTLAAVALVFLLVMSFLFTARSVQVTVVAESEADVDIGGLLLPFGERFLMRPGDYSISATAPGYYPLDSQLVVTDADSQVIELVLQPLPGKLTVNSVPLGARVMIDNEQVGETPLEDYAVAAGEHSLVVSAPRYQTLEQSLAITGREVQQHLDLTLAPAWAEISIDSIPAGATILGDGEAVGTTPATLEILQGERQLMLQSPSYADWQLGLEIVAGEAQSLGTIELEPASGLLSLSSTPTGANVTLDGEFQGQTPLQLALSPDRDHRLAVFKPGYRRYSDTISLQAGSSEEKSIKLRAQLGEVKLRVEPANALVRVNGKPVGQGSQTISLPAVSHSIEVSLAGYASEKQRVTPRPGLQQLVEISLQTEQEAKLARVKPLITSALGQTLLLFSPEENGSGSFTMGASRREPGRRANEVLHPVELQRMFYLQTTEVTNAQFRQFLASHNSGQIEGNSLNREHQPAVQVSWQQAARFCNWLSKREGLPPFYRETSGIVSGYNRSATGYRLPSEAEWAWAGRVEGETLLKFTWGDTFPPTSPVENYADNTSAYVTGRILNGYTDGHVVSAPVGTFSASRKGLYDLGGNVAEWIHDVYIIPSANGNSELDPMGAQSGDNYVIRGASWSLSKLAELRLSFRDYGQAGRDDVGFRIARYAE